MKKYLWLIEWISASILLAVGFVLGFVEGVVFFATGICVALIAILRFIPLIKTTKDKQMKWINSLEIIANIVVGAIMVAISIKAMTNKDFTLGNKYSYIIGSVLVLRGVIYFYGTSIRKEHSDIIKFIASIIILAIGFFFIYVKCDEVTIGYVMFAVCLLCSLYLIFDGVRNYSNYRRLFKPKAKEIKEEVKPIEESNLPEKEKKDDTYTDIIPPQDNSNDRPYVN